MRGLKLEQAPGWEEGVHGATTYERAKASAKAADEDKSLHGCDVRKR
jgi:hypothetical protein